MGQNRSLLTSSFSNIRKKPWGLLPRPKLPESFRMNKNSEIATVMMPASVMSYYQPGDLPSDFPAGAKAFTIRGGFVPEPSAITLAFFIIVALAWRRQDAAVQAIEERDGVTFYVDRTSPLSPMQLVRIPGFRREVPTITTPG